MSTKNELDALLSEEEGLTSRAADKAKTGGIKDRAVAKMDEATEDKGGVETHQRRRKILDATDADILPNIALLDPDMHSFWASTSEDARPSISTLLHNGSEYVTLVDVKEDFKYFARQEGVTNQIRVREMVLLKIPEADAIEYYEDKHHRKPAQLQRDLISQAVKDKSALSAVYGGVDVSELENDDDIAYRTDGSTGSLGGGQRTTPVDIPEEWHNLKAAKPQPKKTKRKLKGV